jgi:hypothetical protein
MLDDPVAIVAGISEHARRGRRRFRTTYLQCLKTRSAWADRNHSQYAVTATKMIEKTNFEKRSCVIGAETREAVEEQSRRAEYNRPTAGFG